MSKFVKLQFELVEYARDGITVVNRVEMNSHAPSTGKAFCGFNIHGRATDREVTLLCQLTTILTALAEEIKEAPA